MVKAVRVHQPGGPEALRIDEVDLPLPAEGEVLLRHTAIGVNLIDIYHRTATSGQYAIARPAVLGVEAAGVIEDIGPTVTGFQKGDRVAYLMVLGAYAEKRIIKASQLVKLPEFISDEQAAAGMVKGITAQYLLTRIFPVRKYNAVLVHAAAGGVGQLLVQWAKHLGAQVIGTVGSHAKVPVATACGCDAVVVLGEQDLAAEVRRVTDGRGVDVAYDSVGKDTFYQSLDAIRPLGMMVSYGQSSGPVPPLEIGVLAQKGSIFLAKPTLATFTSSPETLQELADGLFAAVRDGFVKIEVSRRAPLSEVAQVHSDLEARRSTGAIVLLP
ncbi:2-haloacrylate reductase [compost metagenome]